MSKTFRPWDVDQVWLLPPSVHDFVPAGHPAHLVRDLVRRELDLSAIVEPYEREERGQPPYHPAMMVALLLYAYTPGRLLLAADRQGVRGAARHHGGDRHAAAGLPHHQRLPQAPSCGAGGAVRAGPAAVPAGGAGEARPRRARRHQAQGQRHQAQGDELRPDEAAEAALAAEVQGWLAQAEAADAAEDAEHGAERRGDELPDWVADKQARLERIRAAKAALEAEAKAERRRRTPSRARPRAWSIMADRATRAAGLAVPNRARAQRNFTDPDSRIMKTRDGFIQGYNGQLAVDGAHQIIVAQRLTTNGSDQAAWSRCSRPPRPRSAASPARSRPMPASAARPNLEALAARGIRGYLAPGRGRHGNPDPSGQRQIRPGSRMAAMAAKLRRAGRRSRYRLRKQTVEPVFGQIKHARGFRQFLLRGLAKVQAEWALVCTAHNLTKLVSARTA